MLKKIGNFFSGIYQDINGLTFRKEKEHQPDIFDLNRGWPVDGHGNNGSVLIEVNVDSGDPLAYMIFVFNPLKEGERKKENYAPITDVFGNPLSPKGSLSRYSDLFVRSILTHKDYRDIEALLK